MTDAWTFYRRLDVDGARPILAAMRPDVLTAALRALGYARPVDGAAVTAGMTEDAKAREIVRCLLPDLYPGDVPASLTAEDVTAAMVALCEAK
jgi:hypothetical protein